MILACIATIVINLSNEPFNDTDRQNQKIASERCAVHYPEAPCLKKFIKVEPLVYRAICVEDTKN